MKTNDKNKLLTRNMINMKGVILSIIISEFYINLLLAELLLSIKVLIIITILT